MTTLRYIAWALVLVLAGTLTYVWLAGAGGRQIVEFADAGIGGPFNLTRADGTPITDRDLLGEPHAIFFGFTHCPEVCPTTLFEASGWLEKLGPQAENFSVYFVTVDPERDTTQVLGEYMTSFPRITGITGDQAEIDQMLQSYKVYSRKVPLDDGDYTMDHTATVYLMDAEGEFSGTIAWSEDSEIALKKIRRLIGES
jgi:protein SCO1